MKGFERISPKQKLETVDASGLLSLLGTAGPGADMHIRVYFKDGHTEEGIAKWDDDRANGPCIVLPNKKDPFDEGIIPLGGEVVYGKPPNMNSSDRVGSMPIMFGEPVPPVQKEIDPHTKGIRFEVIKKSK